MTSTYSRQREQAEIAFAKAQSQFLSRERPVDELDAAAQARAEKTMRLKTARLARDRNERTNAAAALAAKPAAKP
jgi:hypothetical protein